MAHPLIAARALQLRHQPTWSEQVLWQHIRARKLGVQFRRQVPLGRYIADFYACSVKLIVEVDGGYHLEREAPDARRDRDLQRRGYRILRLSDRIVCKQTETALQLIRQAVALGAP